MPDNKLRCLLAYRLGKEPVVIAKYDHASQTETHIGESGTLYGGRDKDYADAVALVIGKDPPGQVNDSNKIGGFKVVQSDIHQVVYGADNDDLCKYLETIRSILAMMIISYSVYNNLQLIYYRPCCYRRT